MRTVVDTARVALVYKCPWCGARDEFRAPAPETPPCYVCGQDLLEFDHIEIEEDYGN